MTFMLCVSVWGPLGWMHVVQHNFVHLFLFLLCFPGIVMDLRVVCEVQ